MEKQLPLVLCTTLLVETSPQAIPMGCACIASAIRKKATKQINVEILDFSPEESLLIKCDDEKKADEISKIIIEKKPMILSVSVYVWNRNVLTAVAQKVKKALPETFILAGGPEVTANPNSFVQSGSPFSVVVTGEGEDDVSSLVLSFLDKKQYTGNKIVVGKPYNLEEASSPYLDGTLDARKYSGALWELARGCPYSCSYCYESKGEKKVRYMPKSRLYEELDFFVKNEIGQVFVLDPTYNVDKKRALDMLRYIEKVAPSIFFHFECRPEFIDIKLAKAFSQISCSLQIGLQSSSEKVLATVNRTFNKKEFVRNIGLLNESGAVFGFDLIYGLPGDTFEGFMKSIDFALELYPNHLEIFQLSVLPGTDLFDRAKSLQLTFMPNAPYLVEKTATFSSSDIARAKDLAFATSLFYTQGRAVPWFLALIKPLQKKPSQILTEFLYELQERNITQHTKLSFERLVEIQKDFIKTQYTKKNIRHLLRFAVDVIDLNAAISSYIAEGKENFVDLNYHPDDLLSPYSQDPKYFVQHAEKFPCTVEVGKRVEDETGDIYTIVFNN